MLRDVTTPIDLLTHMCSSAFIGLSWAPFLSSLNPENTTGLSTASSESLHSQSPKRSTRSGLAATGKHARTKCSYCIRSGTTLPEKDQMLQMRSPRGLDCTGAVCLHAPAGYTRVRNDGSSIATARASNSHVSRKLEEHVSNMNLRFLYG
jgi:hypothetical protein